MPELIVEGPYKIPRIENKGVYRIESAHGAEFWANEDVAHLRVKQGCYIFALRAGQGHTPWYVGKAGTGTSGSGFKQETFTADKLEKYNRVLHSHTHGTPVLFFVARPGTKKVVSNSNIDKMEKALIRYAYVKNSDVVNVANARSPGWSIRGVLRGGRGRPTDAARSFKNMMGL